MDNAKFRDLFQGFGNLSAKANNIYLWKAALSQLFFEGDAGDEFHHQEINAILSVKVVDVCDVSVAEARESERLLPETLASRIIGQGTWWEHLQSDVSIQSLIMSPVNHAHTPRSDLFNNSVVPERPSEDRRYNCHAICGPF
jgi:hypothetical protein